MNRELLDISGCRKSLVIEVPGEEVEQEIQRLALEYAHKVQVPGFRPGKVPLKVIRQRYHSELHQDAVRDLISRSWKASISELNLNPLDEPAIEILQDKPEEPLKFSLAFEVLPKIELQGHQGVTVAAPPVEVNDVDVDRALDSLRDQQAQYVPIEGDPIRDGHYVAFSLDGTFADGGNPFHEDEVTCIVGDTGTNEVFSENLRGAKAGEAKSFEVTYPDDYHRKQFAGKRVQYQIQIKDVKEKHLAELNDEFASELGAKDLEALKKRIKDDLVTKAQRDAEKKAKEAVLDDIVKRHSFDVPDCLIQDEMAEHARRIATDLAMRGVNIERASIDWRKVREEGRPFAEQAVRRSLILDAVARLENIEVSEAELEEEIQKHAAANGKSPAALRAQLEKEHKIGSLTEHLRQNKALDFIYRNANISQG